MNTESPQSVPPDFPRDSHSGAVPGAHPKFLARLVDGRYVVGLTEEELWTQYDKCADLVVQLIPYCEKERKEHPEWTKERHLNRIRKGVVAKGWDITPNELDWVMKKLDEALAWT